jgi:diacylglycerol kinase family enzyme
MNAAFNAAAFGGRGRAKWKAMEREIRAVFPNLPADAELFAEAGQLDRRYDTVSVADPFLLLGGGDGTFHAAINRFFDPDTNRPRIEGLTLGLLGLGSSNSFLTSFKDGPFSPLPRAIDVGRVDFTDPQGTRRTRFFLANGSLGFLAHGNRLFNEGGGLTGVAKAFSTEVANGFVFLRLLARHQPEHLSLVADGERIDGDFSNVQFLLGSSFTADLRYRRDEPRPSGLLDLRVLPALGPAGLCRVFFDFSRDRGSQIPGLFSQDVRELVIRSPHPVLMELDGETLEGGDFRVACLPGALKVCF